MEDEILRRAAVASDHQDELKVYAREGEPCRRCRAPVAKVRYANKPLYYCEACQV